MRLSFSLILGLCGYTAYAQDFDTYDAMRRGAAIGIDNEIAWNEATKVCLDGTKPPKNPSEERLQIGRTMKQGDVGFIDGNHTWVVQIVDAKSMLISTDKGHMFWASGFPTGGRKQCIMILGPCVEDTGLSRNRIGSF